MAVNPESRQLEVELLAYDGKTVVLDVAEEALEDLKKLKAGDGATIRVVEENGKRVAKSFRIRPKDPNTAKAKNAADADTSFAAVEWSMSDRLLLRAFAGTAD